MDKMKTNDIKKGTNIRTKQLGVSVNGIMMDSLKGNTRLIKTFGSEIGMFDEVGSVYATDIISAKDSNGNWIDVEHTDKQLNAKNMRGMFGF